MVYLPPNDQFASVRPLWEEWNRLPDTPERKTERRRVEQQIIEKVLTIAEQERKRLPKLATTLSKEEFNDYCSFTLIKELRDLGLCFPDDDDNAERYYQWAMVEKAGAEHGGITYLISEARCNLERAVEKSKRGSGRRLAFYQDELAKF